MMGEGTPNTARDVTLDSLRTRGCGRRRSQANHFAPHTDYLDLLHGSAEIELLSNGGSHGLIQETSRF